MERALELARRGWGRVAPNPLVGAVVLQGGKVVGEGYHAEFGGRHAEVVALEAAGGGARGGPPGVEPGPWAHPGERPPCSGALRGSRGRAGGAAARRPAPPGRGRGGGLA